MMNEDTRKKLIALLESTGIDPSYVVRDGATSDGYRTFVPATNNKRSYDENGELVTRFVPWSEEQKQVIWEHKELFQEWFDE